MEYLWGRAWMVLDGANTTLSTNFRTRKTFFRKVQNEMIL